MWSLEFFDLMTYSCEENFNKFYVKFLSNTIAASKGYNFIRVIDTPVEIDFTLIYLTNLV